MFTALTAFYSLFLTIFALVLELSHLLSGEEQREINTKDMIFGLYMYGVSILFFVYMYVVLLLDPRWYWTINVVKKCFYRSKSSESSIPSAVSTIRKVTHSGSSAGSLFLRLGCVVFGVTGVVYYAFLVFLCSSDANCSGWSTGLDVCAIVFIFTQMHFIFCNSKTSINPLPAHFMTFNLKLSITGHHTASRFGTMHLMAANLWTWIRYVLMEEGVMEKEIRDVFKTISNRTHEMDEESANAFEHRDINIMGSCRAAECILGSLSEVMFTAIVEYSLIAAAVMYIVWRNIGRVGHGSEYVKRKYRIRMDCSNTTTGLFLGLLFLAATFTSMLVYYGYSILGKSKNAAFAYALTDISQELLDQILLWLGLVGELIYSVAGLVGLTGDGDWQPLAFLLFFVHIFRLVQVGTQTFLIYLASRVKVGTASRQHQPGKQAITFLLAANLSIFLMNLFESEKPGISESIIGLFEKAGIQHVVAVLYHCQYEEATRILMALIHCFGIILLVSVFGVIGVVYYSFLVFLCAVDSSCSSFTTTLDICAIIFIFIQMHFIFCNSKLSITGHHPIARFGTMHLIASNLWTWIRYVLLEEGAMEKEIRFVLWVLP
ncbi:hypothetical protein GCK32_011317 [Trichostrongylus colubriformis]|uniref:Uncharacterized protein n=1 Tax=Trichostrongylus colubriformis TaxID=6319 RepID=A0AAN8FT02_TRICO